MSFGGSGSGGGGGGGIGDRCGGDLNIRVASHRFRGCEEKVSGNQVSHLKDRLGK